MALIHRLAIDDGDGGPTPTGFEGWMRWSGGNWRFMSRNLRVWSAEDGCWFMEPRPEAEESSWRLTELPADAKFVFHRGRIDVWLRAHGVDRFEAGAGGFTSREEAASDSEPPLVLGATELRRMPGRPTLLRLGLTPCFVAGEERASLAAELGPATAGTLPQRL